MPLSNGIELSKYAVNHAFCPDIQIANIAGEGVGYIQTDLITAIDVLEHLNDEDLDKTLINMMRHGKRFIFSIPFVGDPNLTNDKTHIQYKTKEQWIKLIESYGIKIKETPKDWLFSNQILVGVKK